MAGLFQSAYFGWFAFVSNLISVFLEEPYEPAKGMKGYGFTPQQTSARESIKPLAFNNGPHWLQPLHSDRRTLKIELIVSSIVSISMWFGVIAAHFWGKTLNDRIPLLISRQQNAWHPEYRLHTLWFPGLIIMPIGLGLFGASLEYHLHYMVLAMGAFFIVFSATAAVPVSLNYVVESFERNPQEVGTCMNMFRLLLGLIIPFFLDEWEEAMSIGWVFGTAAFVSLFTWILIMLLMWKGQLIRQWSVGHTSVAIEDGVKLHR